MKVIFLFFALGLGLFAGDAQKRVTIDGKVFDIIHESYHEYGDKGVQMKLYKKDSDKAGLPLLSFVLEYSSGSCASKSTQEGAYEINATHITLYSHWNRSGRAYDAPVGDRIQYYRVDANGNLVLESGKLYIERFAKRYDPQSGMQYLFTPPQTPMQKKILQSYIETTERIFEGRFVYGKEAETLKAQVEDALMRKHRELWQ